MRVAYITAGAAGRYCGNCLRDSALAIAARSLGEELVLVPTYTPLRTDLPDVSERRLFFNGIRVFLEQNFQFFRKPRSLLDRVIGCRPLISLLSKLGLSTDPSELGGLTVSMLRGDEGHQRKEIDALAAWLASEVEPHVVHLTNALLIGMAPGLKKRLGVPVICGLQSEDLFLEGLTEPWQSQALRLVREHGADVDGFLTVSEYYADHCADFFGLPRDSIGVVLPGIPLEGHEPSTRAPEGPLTLGFLARMAPEKGLHHLCEAFVSLTREPEFSSLGLHAAGYLARRELLFVSSLRRRLATAGLRDQVQFLGTVDRRAKLAFLQGLDVLCVPSEYREPKGLFVLEALASGVPVVVPRHGVFPELLARTGGGLLCEPGDSADLIRALREILGDREQRERLGSEGRQAVLEHFSAERMARETFEFYRRLASTAPR